MRSLRDKLRETAPRQQQAPKMQAVDCYVKEIKTPVSCFLLPEVISGNSLSIMLGGEWQDVRKDEILFLDTETTGLSHGAGTVAFLVGVGYFEGENFLVRQYLMRDYDEETFLLQNGLGQDALETGTAKDQGVFFIVEAVHPGENMLFFHKAQHHGQNQRH